MPNHDKFEIERDMASPCFHGPFDKNDSLDFDFLCWLAKKDPVSPSVRYAFDLKNRDQFWLVDKDGVVWIEKHSCTKFPPKTTVNLLRQYLKERGMRYLYDIPLDPRLDTLPRYVPAEPDYPTTEEEVRTFYNIPADVVLSAEAVETLTANGRKKQEASNLPVLPLLDPAWPITQPIY